MILKDIWLILDACLVILGLFIGIGGMITGVRTKNNDAILGGGFIVAASMILFLVGGLIVTFGL